MILTKQEQIHMIKLKIKEINAQIYLLTKNDADPVNINDQNNRIIFFENMIKDIVDQN